jgi:hypothetical protein
MYNNNNSATNNNEDDSEESSSGWISWFCDLEGHEFFVEVPLNKKHSLD